MWYSLELQLGITKHTLDTIEIDNGRNSTICRRKMFSQWLSTNSDANYKNLVDVLIVIDKSDIAEKVSQQFCKLYWFVSMYIYT